MPKHAPKRKKCAGKLLGILPNAKTAPGKPWERSRMPKTRGESRESAFEARNRVGKATKALLKLENMQGKAQKFF